MLVGIVKVILRTSKGGIGMRKLTEVEELVFALDCIIGSMRKRGCENEGAAAIF